MRRALFLMPRLTLICLLPLLGSGCSYHGQAATSVPAQMTIQEMSPQEAAALWRTKDAVFIDVRTEAEYKEKHIPDAILIPLPELEKRHEEVPHDRPVLLICRSARRSAQANLLLQQLGFSNTFSVSRGMEGWPEKTVSE